MLALVRSVADGGAAAIRANLKWIALIKENTNLPVMGIEKVFRGNEMRITPTLYEVEEIVKSGADALAIDATRRPRFDDLSLEQFIRRIKERFDIPVFGDISVLEEGLHAAEYGVDGVSTTISGYTPYSPNFGKLGDIPPKEPDYQLVTALHASAGIPVICEGRINTPEKALKAFEAHAHAVVVGTAITNPARITALFISKIRGDY